MAVELRTRAPSLSAEHRARAIEYLQEIDGWGFSLCGPWWGTEGTAIQTGRSFGVREGIWTRTLNPNRFNWSPGYSVSLLEAGGFVTVQKLTPVLIDRYLHAEPWSEATLTAVGDARQRVELADGGWFEVPRSHVHLAERLAQIEQWGAMPDPGRPDGWFLMGRWGYERRAFILPFEPRRS